MEERQSERDISNIPELVKRTRCVQKSCPNFDLNCLVMPGQKHHMLTANDFVAWDNAIKLDKASLSLPPLTVRGSLVASKKGSTSQTNNNAFPFSFNFPSSYPFMGSYPMPGYPNYAPPPMYAPSVHQTPTRQAANGVIFSSPIDTSSAINKDISGFMDWMIARAGDDQNEVNELIDAKNKLLVSRPDLEVISTMDSSDCAVFKIEWGLGKRLAREAKKYIKSKRI